MTVPLPLPSMVHPIFWLVFLAHSFQHSVKDEFGAVNHLIGARLNSNVDLVENVGDHIVNAGGKRLRPLVVILSAMANDYQGKDHIVAAAVIEFIHTATLLHDDVVDASSLRRGRNTANSQWGNSSSVLVGDFLYSRAFQMLVEIGNIPVMSSIANASNLISEGEVQQLSYVGNPDIDELMYLEVIYKKTAVLYEASASIGAMLADCQTKAMADYGRHLGLAFQITDDVLDYRGEVDTLGKNIGSDLRDGKMTLPLIYAQGSVSASDKALIRDVVMKRQSKNLIEVQELVRSSGGLEYSLEVARKQVLLAQDALAMLSKNVYIDDLIDLAKFSVDRVL